MLNKFAKSRDGVTAHDTLVCPECGTTITIKDLNMYIFRGDIKVVVRCSGCKNVESATIESD